MNRRLALRAVLPLTAFVVEGPGALAAAIVFQEVGVWLARRLTREEGFAAHLFLGAYLVRAVLATAIHVYLVLTTGAGAFFEDDNTYDLVASWAVRIVQGEGLAVFVGHQHLMGSLYLYVVAAIYGIFGHVPLAPKLLNAAMGGVCTVLMYEIGARVFRPSVGRFVGVVAALLPTLVLWSLFTLKEILVMTGILVALWAMQHVADARFPRKPRATAAVVLMGALVLVGDMRLAWAIILTVVAGGTFAAYAAQRLPRFHLLVAGVVVIAGVVGMLAFARIRMPDSIMAKASQPDEIVTMFNNRRAKEALRADSQLGSGSETDVSIRDLLEIPGYREEPVGDAMAHFVDSMGHALFAPAPWQARRARDIAASAEMVIWYVLTAGVLLSWKARPAQPTFAVSLAFYGAATWLMLALAEGNLGNLLRHRMMLTPTLIVLGCAGLSWATARLTERFGWTLPVPSRAAPGRALRAQTPG